MSNPLPNLMIRRGRALGSNRRFCRAGLSFRCWPARVATGLMVAALLLPLSSSAQETATNSPSAYSAPDTKDTSTLEPLKLPLHCALFEPGSQDFWVANADSKNPAAHCRYTHYNLAELLQPEKPQ